MSRIHVPFARRTLLVLALAAALVPTARAGTVLSSLTDPVHAGTDPALDIVAARVEQQGGRLTFVLETRGPLPSSLPAPGDAVTYLWLLDTDRDPATGQPHGALGSEFNVRVVIGADGGGFVDVLGAAPGGGGGEIAIEGRELRLTVWMSQLGGAGEFDWRCASFGRVGGVDVPGNGETDIAFADPIDHTPPARVTVTTPILQLSPGGPATGRLAVEVLDASGRVLPVEDYALSFHSTNEAVATVDSTGLVTAVAVPQYHWQRPYIEAWADDVMAGNGAVVRVTAADLGVAHRHDAAAHVTLSLVPQLEGVNLDSLSAHFQVLEALERAWVEMAAWIGGLPEPTGRQFVVLDVADTPESAVCGASGNPICLGWLWGQPQHNTCFIINDPANRVPQWFVMFHELGHNFSSYCNSFNMFLWQPSAPHNAAFAEGFASLGAMWAWQAIVAEPGVLGATATASLHEQLGQYAGEFRRALADWRAAGADYETIDADIVDGILLEMLDEYGDKAWFDLISSFLPSPEPLPVALDTREKQATWFVAALSASAGRDLRARFRTEYGFPVDDAAWPEIHAAVAARVAARSWTPLAVDGRPGASTAEDRLLPVAPNPFVAGTAVRFVLARAGSARLAVYDLAGRRVRTLRDGWLPAGAHARVWDGRDEAGRTVAPGVYVVRLQTTAGASARKLTLLD